MQTYFQHDLQTRWAQLHRQWRLDGNAQWDHRSHLRPMKIQLSRYYHPLHSWTLLMLEDLDKCSLDRPFYNLIFHEQCYGFT